ncbi:hypothetical protein OQA88_12494 [Cercophora sp. LCS_1]
MAALLWLTLLLGALAYATPVNITPRNPNTNLVFCHFMLTITTHRVSPSDYDADMALAHSYGIDAFALSIADTPQTELQLDLAYASAASNNMKLFLSFDFSSFSPAAASRVAHLISKYVSHPAQLHIDGRVVSASSSNGTPEPDDGLDGALSWLAWPSDGHNRAPRPGNAKQTGLDGDALYQSWLRGKPLIAPVSPWFFTHYDASAPHPKNCLFPAEDQWFTRWTEILNTQPRFVETLTWNDFGESHYVGPLSSSHVDDGASKWVDGMPHEGWMEMARPFIQAYKEGRRQVEADEERVVYWFRGAKRGVDCDGTDTTMGVEMEGYAGGRPDGWGTVEDVVFVVVMLKEEATVEVRSGGLMHRWEASAGASVWRVEMGVGKQFFRLEKRGEVVMEGTARREVVDECVCGIYNFNAFVGMLPKRETGVLDERGLERFYEGLRVDCTPRAVSGW